MRNLTILSLFILMGCGGCASPATIPVDGAFTGVAVPVLDRLEVYVNAQPQPDAGVLAQIDAARILIASEKEVHVSELIQAFTGLLALHDLYVAGDESLDDLSKSVYTESAERIRSILERVSSRL